MPALTPLITQTPAPTATYNPQMAETFSWIPVTNTVRPLYAKAVYDVATAQSLGQSGFIFTDNNVQVTGGFTTLQVISATKLAGLTATSSTVGNLTAYELPQNFVINGPIVAYKLTYGAVIAYNT